MIRAFSVMWGRLAATGQALVLVTIAALPRLLGLGDFVTVDEGYHWIRRVADFSRALQLHQWQNTNLTGHPGVMTMWLGGLGYWLMETGIAAPRQGVEYLAMLRAPLALIHALGVGVGYLALLRLVRPPVAVAAALLWALTPFLVSFGRLLHVDALMTTFSMLALLLLLVAVLPDAASIAGRRVALVLSAASCGLALLSKSSGVVVVVWAGLVLLAAMLTDTSPGRVGRFVRRGCIWLLTALLVFWVCWPAMWVAPLDTVRSVLAEVVGNGGQAHATGTFFLGRDVADPGWLFYPLVILFRSDPFLLVGLLCWGFAGAALVRARQLARQEWAVLALGMFAVLFVLVVSLAGKKFDRYVLPAFPALCVVAAYGLVWLQERLERHWRIAPATGALGMVAVLGGINAFYHPYSISFYNPLLGGGSVAQRVLPVGWGEGMDQIGAWLRARPDLRNGPVLSWVGPTLSPFLPDGVPVADLRPETLTATDPAPNYVVLYSRNMAWYTTPEAEVRALTPLYTLRLYGIVYATVYQVPRPFEQARPVSFANGTLALRGFSLHQEANEWTITPSWDVRADQPGGVMAFAHVLSASGQIVAQIDMPVDAGMFPEWQQGQQFSTPMPLTLPPDLAPGQYRVIIGAYRAGAPERLSVGAGALPADVDGPDAVLLTTIDVPAAP